MKPLIIAAIHTGIRQGALMGLEWRDIDFNRNIVSVRAELSKNLEAYEVPMSHKLRTLLEQLRPDIVPPQAKVFRSRYGEGFKKIGPIFDKIRKKAGLENFRFHDLRHTFASRLVIRGAGLKHIQELLGHSDIKMTMRYAHLSGEQRQKTVNLLDQNPVYNPESQQFSQQARSQ